MNPQQPSPGQSPFSSPTNPSVDGIQPPASPGQPPAPTPVVGPSSQPVAPPPQPIQPIVPAPAHSASPLGGAVINGQPQTAGSSSAAQPMLGGASAPDFTKTLPPKPKKKLGLIAILVAAFVVLVGGGIAAAYYTLVLPNKPENVLKAALANSFSGQTTSVGFDAEFTTTTDGLGYGMTLSGATDLATGAFDMSMEFDALVTKFSADIRSVDGKGIFFKLGDLGDVKASIVSIAELYGITDTGPVIDDLSDQWYEVNQSLLSSLGVRSFDLSDQDVETLGSALKQHNFFVVSEVLADEQINGSDSHHYKVMVDASALKEFISSIKAIQALEISDEAVSSLSKAIDATNYSDYPMEFWVAKDTRVINKLAMSFASGEAEWGLSVTFRDYNQPVTIEEPADAKSVLDLYNQVIDLIAPFYGELTEDESTTSGISL